MQQYGYKTFEAILTCLEPFHVKDILFFSFPARISDMKPDFKQNLSRGQPKYYFVILIYFLEVYFPPDGGSVSSAGILI